MTDVCTVLLLVYMSFDELLVVGYINSNNICQLTNPRAFQNKDLLFDSMVYQMKNSSLVLSRLY